MLFNNQIMFLFFLLGCMIISVLLVAVSYYGIPRDKAAEKLSAYECGFEPFPEGKYLFDVHFYILALLFIIFDVEIILLTAWGVNIHMGGRFSFTCVMFFVFILFLGYMYEFVQGKLSPTPFKSTYLSNA